MLKNIAWTVFSRYGAQILSVISNILLVRYLGAGGYGEYALASSIMLIGNAVTSFGMDMILIRKLNISPDPALLADGLWGQVLLSILFIGSVFLFGLFIPMPLSLKVYSFSLLPLAFYSIFTIAIRARQNMRIYSIAQLMIAALHLISVLVLWRLAGDVLVFVSLLTVSHVVVAVWGFLQREARITNIDFSFPRVMVLLKECAHMAVLSATKLVYEKMPAPLVLILTSLSSGGVFAAVLRIMDAGKLGHLSALTAVYPEMARDQEFGRLLKGLSPLLAAGLLISIGITAFAHPIILFLFGPEFLFGVLPLRIMAWVIAPYILATYTAMGLVSLGFERSIMNSRFLVLALLISLLLALTPWFGIIGSATALLAAEIAHAELLWRVWRTHVLSNRS